MASIRIKKFYFCRGELAEWSNAVVLKTIDPSRGPGVRIPHSPQSKSLTVRSGFLFFRNAITLISQVAPSFPNYY